MKSSEGVGVSPGDKQSFLFFVVVLGVISRQGEKKKPKQPVNIFPFETKAEKLRWIFFFFWKLL